MLEKINLEKKLGKKEYDTLMEELFPKLGELQRKCRELGIPIMILFEGWGASGKGTLISKLIEPLDPRGFKVYTIQKPSEEEAMRPFLWRFWTKTPGKGRIHIFDRSWYSRVLSDRIDGQTPEAAIATAFHEIVDFEEQLTADGMVIMKFFLHISKKEQTKRFQKLEDSEDTSWRVTKLDWKHNKKYKEYLRINDEMLEKTDTRFAPWTIVESTDREYAAVKLITAMVERLSDEVEKVEAAQKAKREEAETEKATKEKSAKDKKTKENSVGVLNSEYRLDTRFVTGALSGVDLSKTLDKPAYKKRLKELQDRLAVLHNEMYQKRLPVVLAFEGWDAGGKGGAIKRVTQNIDPRGYEVVPTAAPNDIEKAHHYLWRFWNAMPKAGHMAIFDRTWYGRVMVERIEGFCSETEWQRAYNEINHMEEHLANAGYIIIKFWMQIDKDEQERRFKEREITPGKEWKITEEDWRNRAKWNEYEKAVDEMIVRTSTTYAPWVIVEANCKYYARIKVLESVVNTLEQRLKEIKKRK